MDPLDAARDIVASRHTGALLTLLADGSKAVVDANGVVVAGSLTGIETIIPDVLRMMQSERSGTVGGVFVETLAPEPRLLVFGAGPIAEALCAMAATTGFAVEVVDPRPAFAREERFPAATAVHRGWPAEMVVALAPDASSYAVSLLHEARFEDELLPALLHSDVRYIGALGSSRTHAARCDRLREAGFTETEIAAIHGPVGLAIGAATPAEIAVAILAEIVAVRRSV